MHRRFGFRSIDRTNFVVDVDDDGTRFGPAAAHRGEGLTNLENRAAALGGKAIIERARRTTARPSVWSCLRSADGTTTRRA
jgi:signal transduction histidine kinase